MATITITHNHEDGTLLTGSTKGDGVYEIARRNGFAYFPSIRAIGIRASRDQMAKRWKIDGAAEALRAAGHDVTVEIDNQHRDRATVLTDQAERLDDRRDRLEQRAEKWNAKAQASRNSSDRLTEHIPMGQPILIGHYSERADRNRRNRAMNLMFRSLDEQKVANELAQRADAVGGNVPSTNVAATRRRIERAEAELRGIGRELDGHTRRSLDGQGNPVCVDTFKPATGGYRENLLARKAQIEDQVTYDQQIIAQAAEAGAPVFDKSNVHVGDLIADRRGLNATWRKVVKVNKVTVACETGYSWTDKIRYSQIAQVRCEHPKEG